MTAPTVSTTLRERLLARTAEVTGSEGWTAVTMGRLATEVGVSRQTVYNEVGDKASLGEAVVMRELGRFLAVVDDDLQAEPDVAAAVRRAVHGVLESAAANPLLRAILCSSHGAHSELLPLLTTRSAPVTASAIAALRPHLARLAPHACDESLDACADMTVRLVLSHVTQPGGGAAETADTVALMVSAVLGPA